MRTRYALALLALVVAGCSRDPANCPRESAPYSAFGRCFDGATLAGNYLLAALPLALALGFWIWMIVLFVGIRRDLRTIAAEVERRRDQP